MFDREMTASAVERRRGELLEAQVLADEAGERAPADGAVSADVALEDAQGLPLDASVEVAGREGEGKSILHHAARRGGMRSRIETWSAAASPSSCLYSGCLCPSSIRQTVEGAIPAPSARSRIVIFLRFRVALMRCPTEGV